MNRGERSAGPFTVGLFAVYLAMLAWIVLWKLDVPAVGTSLRVIKLVPFIPSGGEGSNAPFELGMNLLIFVPFGLYVALLAPGWRWWRVLGVAAATSAALEALQFVLAVGRSDLTDVIMNATGGLLGFLVVEVVRRGIGPTAARRVVVGACSIATVVALLGAGAVVSGPMRYGPPPPMQPADGGSGQLTGAPHGNHRSNG